MFISNTTNASLWLFPYLNTIKMYCSLIIFRLRGINQSETFRNVRRRSESERTFRKRFNTKSRRTSTLAEVHTYRALTRPWKEDRSFWNRLKWSSCWAGECLSVIRRGRRLHHVMQGSFCDALCENDLGRGPLLDQLVTHIHRIPSTSSSARPSALHATRGKLPTRPAGDSRSEVCLMLGSRRVDRGGRKA